jgi:hypothetical protein
VYDLETSRVRRLKPARVINARYKKKKKRKKKKKKKKKWERGHGIDRYD